jgi:hypothetical protein
MDLTSFISNWLSVWTGNKPQNLLKFYSDNIFYSDPANPTGIKNKTDLEIYFSKLLAKNPDWVWVAEEIIPTAKGCTLKWKASIPSSGETITLYGLDIVEIENWKITRNEVYFDRVPWLNSMKKL